MRSGNDLHIISLAVASVILAGCAQDNVKPQTSSRANQIYYEDLQVLPDGVSTTISLSSPDGRQLVPDLKFNVSELPVYFDWPQGLQDEKGNVRVRATLELEGQVLAQAQAHGSVSEAIRLQLGAISDSAQSPALAGTQWRVLSYGGRSALDYTSANVNFGPDGVLSGNGGCNQYQARYQHVGALVAISPLNVTRKICFSSVMYQEHSLFKLLGTVTHLRWSGEELLLFSDSSREPVRLASLKDS